VRAMSYSAFERRYKPFQATELGFDGSMGEHMVDYATARGRKPEQVWTVVDCDGKLYLASGFHVVNRMGYIVCAEPHDDTDRPVLY
jgi:hypothetical protein